jgi:hypothetical protein
VGNIIYTDIVRNHVGDVGKDQRVISKWELQAQVGKVGNALD